MKSKDTRGRATCWLSRRRIFRSQRLITQGRLWIGRGNEEAATQEEEESSRSFSSDCFALSYTSFLLCCSYGALMSIAIALVRESSALMVGQYFKRRRDFVEIVVQIGAGIGVILFSVFFKEALGLVVALRLSVFLFFFFFLFCLLFCSSSCPPLYFPTSAPN